MVSTISVAETMIQRRVGYNLVLRCTNLCKLVYANVYVI